DANVMEDLIHDDPSLGEPLHPVLPYCGAEVLWATRVEMARTLEDVLARRTRALFLNARAACEMAVPVAAIMARELEQSEEWQRRQVQQFQELARGYMLDESSSTGSEAGC
ncbi:MAG: glycerol-3-phosphate dehydrogenase C-terminal domain-containing protein, partial [Acidobacteriaceae bacterium]